MEKQKLPNQTLVMVLGIVSIVLSCCCLGFLGIIPAIIGLILANSAIKQYNKDPEQYESVSNLKTGKIINILGIILSVLFTILFAIEINKGVQEFGGWDAYIQSLKDAIENVDRY